MHGLGVQGGATHSLQRCRKQGAVHLGSLQGCRKQGAGDHGSHAKYTHHDEDLSRAMENLPEVKEKRFPYWKREGKLVFTGEGNMRFLKNLAVNLLITQVPALFLLIGYPHASLKEIILLSAGTLIFAVYISRYIIKSIRGGHVLKPTGEPEGSILSRWAIKSIREGRISNPSELTAKNWAIANVRFWE